MAVIPIDPPGGGTTPVAQTQSMTLFVYGKDVATKTGTLFIEGSTDPGFVSMYGQVPLVTTGSDSNSNTTTLLVQGADQQTGSTPLYTFGYTPVVSQDASTTLYIFGDPQTAFGSTTLYEMGGSSSSADITLFSAGHGVMSSGMILVVGVEAFPFADKAADLYVEGGAFAAGVDSADLFVEGGLWSFATNMVLMLAGSDTDRTVRNMNLWVRGEAPSLSAGADLYLRNDHFDSSRSATLFVKVDGVTEGATMYNSNMILFLQRPFETGIPLFLQGPGNPVVSPTTTLFVESATAFSGSVTFVVPNVVGVLKPQATLYTNGW